MIGVNPEITSFESMEVVITAGSITIRLSVIYRMPPVKSKNGLKQGTFCNEFNDYLEKLSCMNGNIVIVGDFNIDWLNTNGSERKQFCNILETFGFVQNICTETHRSHHLLDYIITRKDCNIISDFLVSDFISDHRALHASLQCIRPHPVRKQISVRAIRRIKDDAIVKDLDKFSIDQRCVDMNVQSLGNKLDCVIDHITDNRIDIVGITETWLSNDDKNNMSVVNTCLNNGYTLLHRPRNTGRRGGGVGVLINNQINVKSRMIGVNPEITSFESMEVVITAGSITIRLSVIYRMPPVKSKNGLKQGTFCNEFNDYLEKLSCMNGNIVIVGDFNIDWLNTNGSERKQFCNILETFGFVQNICTETHRSHHLLNYIITRKDCNIISDFLVSDFISDHRALHASLQCIRPHPVRKQISVRAIRRIKDDAIVKDLDKFSIDQRCVDMNVQSLGNKLDCVIDHITDNRIDIVGITETWLSNDDKNNMSVVNTCLNNGYTLLHRPRNTGRRGGGVGVLINNQINVKSRMIGVNPEITSFESMEIVITAGSITIRLSVIYRMPPVKSKNGLKQGTFCNEFNYSLEKLSCMNGNIVIVGDFNIDWLNTNGSERKLFCNILETFGFVQNICTETHRSHHLLDYIITRKDCNIISDFLVSDFISDHRALHASLQCIRPHPVRKQISVRAIRRIKDDAIVKDLDKFSIDQRCVDMNVQSLGNKLDCVIDHIPDNRIDIVGITETWLSNDDKNNMSVVNTCLNNGYTLLHRPRNTGRRGGGVGELINNQINVKSRMIGVNPEITSFESMEVVITAGSITIRLSVIYRMPPVKSKNGLKQGTFCNEFNYSLEKLSCMNGNIVIVGDFNIDWLNTNGSERKLFCNILETFGFVQNICTETHRSHHLLDYIITRKDCNIISDFLVSDFISDHRALHASLQCIRPHPVRKQISVRAIRRIKDDAIVKDLDKFSIDQRCVEVNTMVEMYDRFLSEFLDKHAPLKNITVVDRPLNEWMTNNILALKAIRREMS